MKNHDEATIIAMLREPDRVAEAFDAIIDRYNERLYWHIRRIVVLHEDAEDVLQETFVTAYASRCYRQQDRPREERRFEQ